MRMRVGVRVKRVHARGGARARVRASLLRDAVLVAPVVPVMLRLVRGRGRGRGRATVRVKVSAAAPWRR